MQKPKSNPHEVSALNPDRIRPPPTAAEPRAVDDAFPSIDSERVPLCAAPDPEIDR